MAKSAKLSKVKGTNLDDVFQIGDPDFSYDGKKGIDIAIFESSFEDFDFARKGTGNDKVTVTDSTGGIYEFKKVETILFNNGTADLGDDVYYNTATGATTRVDTQIDASAQDGGEMFVGSGNSVNDFVVTQSESAGVELALAVKYRQGPSQDPVSVDADGTVHFQVEDGAQSTTNGSSSNNANRAAWSFDYSIATGLDGATTDLSDFTFKLLIDVDPTAGTEFRELTMVDPGVAVPNDTGFIWVDQDGIPRIGDDGGNANVAQNSENYAFGFIEDFIDADPNTPGQQPYAPGFGPAEFDIRLEAYDGGHNLIAANQIAVEVIDFV
ncbi:hypothetical protein VSX64_12155 [Aurantimonas sp. C2-6-R+9]|uniref:Uncharacterized protein n=2 Tax=root TaxID=1 RepID=A0A9C9NI58_9HYPH|nr:hypothetical protein [Aurantimonas sp. C2-6-R+9]HEU02067.1 hypothetical protein [Aurantimonas coralicida]